MKRWTHVVLSGAALGALLFIGEFGNTLSAGQQLGPQALPTAALQAAPLATGRPRVVVTTDPELDDSNSLVRYLLHTMDVVTEGLIYASSGVHRLRKSGVIEQVPDRPQSKKAWRKVKQGG